MASWCLMVLGGHQQPITDEVGSPPVTNHWFRKHWWQTGSTAGTSQEGYQLVLPAPWLTRAKFRVTCPTPPFLSYASPMAESFAAVFLHWSISSQVSSLAQFFLWPDRSSECSFLYLLSNQWGRNIIRALALLISCWMLVSMHHPNHLCHNLIFLVRHSVAVLTQSTWTESDELWG